MGSEYDFYAFFMKFPNKSTKSANINRIFEFLVLAPLQMNSFGS